MAFQLYTCVVSGSAACTTVAELDMIVQFLRANKSQVSCHVSLVWLPQLLACCYARYQTPMIVCKTCVALP